MTHEETEEKKHLIQLDWSSHGNKWEIEYAENVLLAEDSQFAFALYEFAQENKPDFRRFLEDKYGLERKYIDEKMEED